MYSLFNVVSVADVYKRQLKYLQCKEYTVACCQPDSFFLAPDFLDRTDDIFKQMKQMCIRDRHCAHDAVHLNTSRKAEIDYTKCVGCGQCVAPVSYTHLQELSCRYNTAVLVKGGHLEGNDMCDVLYCRQPSAGARCV